MAKQGIQHLMCKKHGAQDLELVEYDRGMKHEMEVRCRICNKHVNWCSLDQAEQMAVRNPYIPVRPSQATIDHHAKLGLDG